MDRVRPVYTVLVNKYWIDELYHVAIVRPLIWISDTVLYRMIDARIVDGYGVDGVANTVRNTAERGLKFLQTGMTQFYMFVMLIGGIVLVIYLVGSF